MKLAVRDILCDLVRQNGRDVYKTPERLRSLLNDMCPDCDFEIALIMDAYRYVLPSLYGFRNTLPPEVYISGFSEEFQQATGIPLTAAKWAVETWALVLGVAVPGGKRRMSPTDGKEQVWIPPGEFRYGVERHRLILPGFWIDVTPVTQAEYRQFLLANPHYPVPASIIYRFRQAQSTNLVTRDECTEPYTWNRQSRTPPPGKEAHPVVWVSWHDAMAYAQWAGKRLPTEQEWEKAARGTDGREYPWGNRWEAERCNTLQPDYATEFDEDSVWTVAVETFEEVYVPGTTPVGKYSPRGDSPYGCVDMVGNVWEWTIGDGKDEFREVYGGCWNEPWYSARITSSQPLNSDDIEDCTGFRCVG